LSLAEAVNSRRCTVMCRSGRKRLRHWQWSDQLWLHVRWHSAGGSTCRCDFVLCRKDNTRSLFCWTCQICLRCSSRCCYWYVLFQL